MGIARVVPGTELQLSQPRDGVGDRERDGDAVPDPALVPPPPPSPFRRCARRKAGSSHGEFSFSRSTWRQGLTLVHFSAQLEPRLSQTHPTQPKHPQTPTEHGLHNPYAHSLSLKLS